MLLASHANESMTPTLVSSGRLNHTVGLYLESFPLYLPKTDAVRGISVLLSWLFSSLPVVLLDKVQLGRDLVFLLCILSLCPFVIDFVVEYLYSLSFPPLFGFSEAIDLDVVDADVEKHLEETVEPDVLK